MKTPRLLTIAAISAGLAFGAAALATEENEETVQMSSLPEAVQKTIKAKAGSNESEKVEKKTEKGKTV